jgi:uncharacterized membrane protein YeaQ/YmgE (transglycosylase-associated protein family)
MTWTVTNLVIQIIAGVLGGHALALAMQEHSVGALGRTIAGAVGGGISGCFLQTAAPVLVNGGGALNEARLFDQALIHSFTGAVAGGIVMLMVGFFKSSIDELRGGDRPGVGTQRR